MTQKRKGKIKLKKRLLSILLTAVLVLSAVPLGLVDTAYAAETVRSGACGDNVTWKLTSDGTLTISGKGATYDFLDENYNRNAPWSTDALRPTVKKVVVNKGVTYLGTCAFTNCTNLTSVSLPTGLQELGADVFMDCSKLTSVTIPSGVTRVSGDLFYGCTALQTVSLPDSLTAFGGCTFMNCTSLTSVRLPASARAVSWQMFRNCTKLTTVTIPRAISVVGANAFNGCTALKTVNFGGNQADWKAMTINPGNTPLTTATVKYTNVTALSAPTLTGSEDRYGCPDLKWGAITGAAKYEIWRGEASSLGDHYYYSEYGQYGAEPFTSTKNAYHDEEALEMGVTYYYKVRAIAADGTPGTFSNEYSFTYIPRDPSATQTAGGTIGALTWKLDKGTLIISGAGAMPNYTPDDEAPWYADRYRREIRHVLVKSGVTSIGGRAFVNCSQLTSVSLPDDLQMINYWAFGYCEKLTSLHIPSGVYWIANNAFDSCTGLTALILPYALMNTGYHAFQNCSALKTVAIPRRIAAITNGSFAGCNALTTVNFGGDQADWNAVYIGPNNDALQRATINYTAISAPKAPTGVTVTADSSGFPVVKWNGVAGATDYEVWRSINNYYEGYGADGFWRQVTQTGTAYTDKSGRLENGVPYLYMIRAISADGTRSAFSAAVEFTYENDRPAAPVVKIGNSATSGKPMLTWNAVYGATSYRIYRSTSRGSGYSLLGTTTATSYTNTGAKAGTTYYYRVKACNDAGLSPYSNVVSGKVKSVTPKPSAPVVKIGHSASSGKPMLTWNAVSGATSYKVYRATSQNGTYSLLGTVTVTSYTNTGAKDGVTYYYKVKAVNSAGESAYSNTVSGQSKSVTPKPSAPVVKIGHSASSGKPMLTWNAVDGAASYKVYRATSKNGAYRVINTTNALTYTNTGAALGTTYYYKVEALNAAGKSMGFSDVVEGKVAPVLAVGYSSVSGKPQLTWKAVPGATEYQVYRSTQQNSGYAKINTTTATSYVNTGAKANTTYYYKIVAVKGTAVSDFSNIVSARPSK